MSECHFPFLCKFFVPNTLFDDRCCRAISRQFAAMSTCRPSCSRLNFNEQASPLLKGYVIERRSCDLAPMPCFLPLPVNLPIGNSIGVPTAMRRSEGENCLGGGRVEKVEPKNFSSA